MAFMYHHLNLQTVSLALTLSVPCGGCCSGVECEGRTSAAVMGSLAALLCSALSLQKNTRVYPCMWCKTLCKNFDMLPNVDRSGKMGLFCSICCTTSHKVKQSGLVGKGAHRDSVTSPLLTPSFVLFMPCG